MQFCRHRDFEAPYLPTLCFAVALCRVITATESGHEASADVSPNANSSFKQTQPARNHRRLLLLPEAALSALAPPFPFPPCPDKPLPELEAAAPPAPDPALAPTPA